MEKTQKNKEKKIMFSEKIDDAINGFSIGITFILVALFLFWKKDYLLTNIATQIVSIIVGLFGFCMCAIQLGKSSTVKGFDDLGLGLFFFVIWLICYVKINSFWLNLILLVLLVAGTYGIVRGVIEIIYSIFSTNKKTKTTRVKEIFLLITQFFGLILTVLNILKIFGVVGI